MKRRAALKRIAYATGFVVATPTVLSLLNSCSTPLEQWTPNILSPEEGRLLTKLTDVFLPKTEELPSATELNVPEFIDRYVDEVYMIEDQKKFKTAFEKMTRVLQKHSKIIIDEIEDTHLKSFLDDHLKVNGEIDEERLENPDFDGITTS